jgi:hypothetical protein
MMMTSFVIFILAEFAFGPVTVSLRMDNKGIPETAKI